MWFVLHLALFPFTVQGKVGWCPPRYNVYTCSSRHSGSPPWASLSPASGAPTNTSRLGKAHQLRLSRAGCLGRKEGPGSTCGGGRQASWPPEQHTPQTKTRHCVCVSMHGKDGRQTQLREKWLTQMPIEPAKAHACSRRWEQARREKRRDSLNEGKDLTIGP